MELERGEEAGKEGRGKEAGKEGESDERRGKGRRKKTREGIYLWTIESSITRIKAPFLFTITLI